MSKWINADAMIRTLGVSDEDINFREILDSAPSIDIVRCKECKHNVGLTNGFWEEDIVCDYWESDGLTADDFCSYGERKGE